jgi:hypothetical protein
MLNMATCLMFHYGKPMFQTMGQVDKKVSLIQLMTSNFGDTNRAGMLCQYGNRFYK